MKSIPLRRMMVWTLVVSMGLPLLPALPAPTITDVGFECQIGHGTDVSGLGPNSQAPTHYRVFMNRFHAPATRSGARLADRKGGCREDTQDLIRYYAGTDEATVHSMLVRDSDVLGRSYYYFGLSRPLTSAEKYLIESDVGRFKVVPYPILHLPLWVEGQAVAYNIGCPINGRLKLSALALNQIFSGVAQTWNSSSILVSHPELATCNQQIAVAVRADVSEQTTLFKDYLSKRNPQWRSYKENSLNTQWPSSLVPSCRGLGDDGMATCLAGQSGSIAYVGYRAAFQSGIDVAAVENSAGTFVEPTLAGCTIAAEQPTAGYPPAVADSGEAAGAIAARADWSRTSLTDQPLGYPICALQFGLAFEIMAYSYQQVGVGHVRTVKDYMRWAVLDETQKRLANFHLARLPDALVNVTVGGADAIRFAE